MIISDTISILSNLPFVCFCSSFKALSNIALGFAGLVLSQACSISILQAVESLYFKQTLAAVSQVTWSLLCIIINNLKICINNDSLGYRTSFGVMISFRQKLNNTNYCENIFSHSVTELSTVHFVTLPSHVGYTPTTRCITDLNYVSSLLGSGYTLLCHQATWIGTKLADSAINGA